LGLLDASLRPGIGRERGDGEDGEGGEGSGASFSGREERRLPGRKNDG